jgi:restriction system protein
MSIPDFQTIMLPFLKSVGDEKEHSLRETIEYLATQFDLSVEERKELLESGQERFNNRVGWARTYLNKSGLIEPTRRGYFRITAIGKEVLAKNPDKIDIKFLEQFPEFIEFRQTRKPSPIQPSPTADTPEEALENSHKKLREGLASELLSSIRDCSPVFFERLVVDVLVKMGYGGSRREAGRAIGGTKDGGIDGIIKEDKLGLDIIYIQAKRWDATVGRPEIQKFAGALQGQRARKGIFITISNFSRDAMDYVKHLDSKIILIDGQQLAELMIDNNVGVSPVATYEVKKIDSDYFIEE